PSPLREGLQGRLHAVCGDTRRVCRDLWATRPPADALGRGSQLQRQQMVPHHPPVASIEPAGKSRIHLLRPVLPAVRAVHAGFGCLARLRGRPARPNPRVDGAPGVVASLLQPVRAAPYEPGWAAARGLPTPRLPGRPGCGRFVVPARALPGVGVGQGPLRTARGWLVPHAKDGPYHQSRRTPAAAEEPEPVAPSATNHTERGWSSRGPHVSPR